MRDVGLAEELAQDALVAALEQWPDAGVPDNPGAWLMATAQALAPRLRVCGVAPGVTLPSGAMNRAEFDASHRMTPLKRGSTPEDVARAVRFLLESPAITGTTLLVDGGQHLQAQSRDVMFLARDSGAT